MPTSGSRRAKVNQLRTLLPWTWATTREHENTYTPKAPLIVQKAVPDNLKAHNYWVRGTPRLNGSLSRSEFYLASLRPQYPVT